MGPSRGASAPGSRCVDHPVLPSETSFTDSADLGTPSSFDATKTSIPAKQHTINLTQCRINCTLSEMKPRHDIQNVVRQHRVLSGLTQEDLADRVGVTRQTILSIEKGKYTPSVALALALAEVFGVAVETLFRLKEGDGHD